MARNWGVISLSYINYYTLCVFDVQSLPISLLQSSKSIHVSEDMEVKGESLFRLTLSLTYWFRLQ